MSEWSEQLVQNFSQAMRRRRTELGLTARELVERCEEAGHPIGRSAIAAWENNQRGDRLMLGDAMAIAYALRTPLATMLYPGQPDAPAEVAPGVTVDSLSAANQVTGVGNVHPPADDADARGEWTTGTRLHVMALQLARLRATRDGTLLQLDTTTEPSRVSHLREQLANIEDSISEKSEEIRLIGGVVNE